MIIFDTGPIISLAVNNLLWLLDSLKESYSGDFVITQSVKGELIDRPINSKKFKFEALQVLGYVRKGTIKLEKTSPKLKKLTMELLDLANSCYTCGDCAMRIIHYAEMEAIALALITNADCVVVDERMMRAMVEGIVVDKLLTRKFHKKVFVNKQKLKQFHSKVKSVKIIRSTELVAVAYEKGWLDSYMPTRKEVSHPKRSLLSAVLWALKLRGAAISRKEIDNIVQLETAPVS